MIFDSHAHYTDERFDNDRFSLLDAMPEKNVGMIMNSCSGVGEIPAIIKMCERYGFMYGSVGVHPHEAANMTENDIDELIRYSKHDKIKAIGEIGLDYYYDNSPRELQKKWFAYQTELAIDLDMPIVIHDRDAHGDCMDILRAYKGKVRGEFHCYSGSREMAREILDMGLYIAFGGSVTFKNASRVCEAAQYVPLDRLLVETDCPYLTPVPHRGERNDSSYIKYVIGRLSEIKNIPAEKIEEITFENAKKLFDIR